MNDYQKHQLTELKNNSEKDYIYSVWSNHFGEADCFGYFMNYENAFELGKALKTQFNIQVSYILDAPSKKGFPKPLDDENQKYTPNSAIATIRYDATGEAQLLILND